MTDTTFDYPSSPASLFAVAAREVPKVVWAWCPNIWRWLSWKWLKFLFVKKPAKRIFEVPYVPIREPFTPDFKLTKAYADQRQKTSRNRKRHLSKRMRNIYKE